MTTSFEYCFKLIVGEEGGYVNNPKDPGGETKWGISKRAYPYLSIPELTIEHAKEIYHEDYWSKVRGDDLPKPLGLCMFDCAVNMGNDAAIRLLQGEVGADVDGIFGQQTMLFIKQRSLEDIINNFMAARAVRYSRMQNYDAFGKGWTRRLMRIHAEAIRTL